MNNIPAVPRFSNSLIQVYNNALSQNYLILCFAGASKTDERPAIIMNSTLSCIIETNLDYYMFLGYFI